MLIVLTLKDFFLNIPSEILYYKSSATAPTSFFSNKGNKCEETCVTMVQKGPYRGKGKGRHRIWVGTFMGSL